MTVILLSGVVAVYLRVAEIKSIIGYFLALISLMCLLILYLEIKPDVVLGGQMPNLIRSKPRREVYNHGGGLSTTLQESSIQYAQKESPTMPRTSLEANYKTVPNPSTSRIRHYL